MADTPDDTEPEFTDEFPTHEESPGGPAPGSTKGQIDPQELFSNPEDFAFFDQIGEDWERRKDLEENI